MHTSFIVLLTAVVLVSPALLQSAEAQGLTDQEQTRGELTLDQAITNALKFSPSLAAGAHAVSAAEARVTQASKFLNPELEMEVENFGGRDELNGFDGADSTVAIAQPFLLGGDRARRRDVADAEVLLAASDLDLQRRGVLYRTHTAFFELLAAQQEFVLAEELLELAEDFARTVKARVDAGKVSPIESTRARIETAHAEVALSNALHNVNRSRVHLAAAWGSSNPNFERAVGHIPAPEDLPPYPDLERLLRNAPEAEIMRRNLTLHERSLRLEKALAIPDLRVHLGTRHFRESGQSAGVAGLSIPIPVFDRNQGAHRAAEFELDAARRTTQAVNAEQHARLRSLVERLLAAKEALRSMTQVVEPAATEAFAAVTIGYREGKFAFIDLLQAQQVLFEARTLALGSRLDYALALCDLEHLVGPLSQTLVKEQS